jgi:hypothetical protein
MKIHLELSADEFAALTYLTEDSMALAGRKPYGVPTTKWMRACADLAKTLDEAQKQTKGSGPSWGSQ